MRNATLERVELIQELNKDFSGDIQKLNAAVAEEKKVSEETEEALLEMLKEMVNRMKVEIENEKESKRNFRRYSNDSFGRNLQ